jgi:FkbM family methyltransferase
MQFGSLKLKYCKYGWMLFSGPYIGKCFDLYGQYSESEVALMRALLRAGDTVVDVGANIGDLTIPLSRIVGESGAVYAVESHPENFNVLCANLALNGIRNARPINAFVATSNQVDTAARRGKFAYVSEKWATAFLALDQLDMPACHLIKVDVDGKELDVLQSAEMQIERFRPVLYVENDTKDASPALIKFISDKLAYDLYWHLAPIFEPDNFFGNPTNHWAPRDIVSVMMVGVPSERKQHVQGLRRVSGAGDWWDAR